MAKYALTNDPQGAFNGDLLSAISYVSQESKAVIEVYREKGRTLIEPRIPYGTTDFAVMIHLFHQRGLKVSEEVKEEIL